MIIAVYRKCAWCWDAVPGAPPEEQDRRRQYCDEICRGLWERWHFEEMRMKHIRRDGWPYVPLRSFYWTDVQYHGSHYREGA